MVLSIKELRVVVGMQDQHFIMSGRAGTNVFIQYTSVIKDIIICLSAFSFIFKLIKVLFWEMT